ncbi:PIN domain-containing protein [Candidatus Saganbacteria bacterium]|nr:PIN domain-containing protein [Candidatus Saganbacteria bacterium]
MEIFIDTGIFCAIANSKDVKNEEVKYALEALAEKGNVFYTSDYVLDETYTLIRSRVNHSAATKFMEEFKSSGINVKRISEEIEELAKKIFIKYKDQEFSFTDCTSFSIIETHKIKGVLSLDKDFRHYKYAHAVESLV